MSNFELKEIKSRSTVFGSNYWVKPIDNRWKNFPPCFMPKPLVDVLEKVKNFKVNEDDVILTGYPRSGTTVVAEMMWLVVNGFDFERANQLVTDDRVPGLE
jgi:Sulfotransferase domain